MSAAALDKDVSDLAIRGEHAVLCALTHLYQTTGRGSGRSGADAGLKTEFKNACKGINPAFNLHNEKTLWRMVKEYHRVSENREDLAAGGGGSRGLSPITVQSAHCAKQTVEHLETHIPGPIPIRAWVAC
jgi:hypothetical protein